MKTDHYVLPKLSQIPADVIAICDYERLAKEYMPHGIYEYIAGGAGDDITLNRNRAAFDAIGMNKRVLRKFTKGTTEITLSSDRFNWPMLIAPLAYQSLLHPEGELATAQAANAVNMGMMSSTLSTVRLEEIAAKQQTPSNVRPPWFDTTMPAQPLSAANIASCGWLMPFIQTGKRVFSRNHWISSQSGASAISPFNNTLWPGDNDCVFDVG